jgi:glycosyltransferase involved in cell wall biosynthesis
MLLTGPPDPHDPENFAYFQALKDLRKELGLQTYFHFAYDIGGDPQDGAILDMQNVSVLYRMCDALFMPSRREGFGMPILEAGFLGKPIFASSIPAVEEIGRADVHLLDIHSKPADTAKLILDWTANDPVYRLRKKTRENFTWGQIFKKQIEPLLENV